MGRDVVLVFPKFKSGWEAQPWRDLPLGLLSVGTPVVQAGRRVRIIDQRVESDWERVLLSELQRRPLCVGISSMTGPQLNFALAASREVKKRSNVPVVWGGVHPSILPEQKLKNQNIDIVVQGEGEETFLDLVLALEENRPLGDVKGIWYKADGELRKTEPRGLADLNSQPALDYSLVNVKHYLRRVFGVDRISFSASRGCCFDCSFCFNTVFYGSKWRGVAPDRVLDLIEDLVRRFSIRGIFLTDSNFFMDRRWARAILEGVVQRALGIVFSRIHVRLDSLCRLTDDDLRLLERSGCKCLAIGVESGSPRIRELLHKPIDEAALHETNQRLARFSLMPLYFFMIGYPTETMADLQKTVRLFTKLVDENPRANKSINVYTPYPGTELFQKALQEGLKAPERLEDWVDFNYRHLGGGGPWLSPEMRRAVKMLDFCAFFVGEQAYLRPFKQTHPLATLAARMYAPVARQRTLRLFSRFPVEIWLARQLRLYARQD
jgi:anaerobic magnesium-protoporphyrin IX monomethyl ester cyclase